MPIGRVRIRRTRKCSWRSSAIGMWGACAPTTPAERLGTRRERSQPLLRGRGFAHLESGQRRRARRAADSSGDGGREDFRPRACGSDAFRLRARAVHDLRIRDRRSEDQPLLYAVLEPHTTRCGFDHRQASSRRSRLELPPRQDRARSGAPGGRPHGRLHLRPAARTQISVSVRRQRRHAGHVDGARAFRSRYRRGHRFPAQRAHARGHHLPHRTRTHGAREPAFRFAAICEADAPFEPWHGLRGRLSRAHLEAIAPDFPEREVYVCGPRPYMAACAIFCARRAST